MSHRDSLANNEPKDIEMGWIAGRITVDEGHTNVDAEYRDDYRWNGWLVPRMRRDAAEQVFRALAEDQPDYYIIMLDGEDFVFVQDDSEMDVQIYGPDAEGWYSPGAMGWCWEASPFWGESC